MKDSDAETNIYWILQLVKRVGLESIGSFLVDHCIYINQITEEKPCNQTRLQLIYEKMQQVSNELLFREYGLVQD